MSELETIAKIFEDLSAKVGPTGAVLVVVALLYLRNQGKMLQAIVDSNKQAADQRQLESEQDANLLNSILTQHNTVLADIGRGFTNVLAGFERFGALINSNSEKSSDVLDEIRTHENAALARWEKVHNEHEKTRQAILENTEKIQKAHTETRLSINPIATNVYSMQGSVQGVNTSMANFMDMNKKEFEELRKLIKKEFEEIKSELAQLSVCNNKADIEKATHTIEAKLETIQNLVTKDKEDANREGNLEQ